MVLVLAVTDFVANTLGAGEMKLTGCYTDTTNTRVVSADYLETNIDGQTVIDLNYYGIKQQNTLAGLDTGIRGRWYASVYRKERYPVRLHLAR